MKTLSSQCNAAGGGEATVCKLQVGLLGSARGLQKDLEKIADRADTNTPDGLHYVLQGMTSVYLSMPRLSWSIGYVGMECFNKQVCWQEMCLCHGRFLNII